MQPFSSFPQNALRCRASIPQQSLFEMGTSLSNEGAITLGTMGVSDVQIHAISRTGHLLTGRSNPGNTEFPFKRITRGSLPSTSCRLLTLTHIKKSRTFGLLLTGEQVWVTAALNSTLWQPLVGLTVEESETKPTRKWPSHLWWRFSKHRAYSRSQGMYTKPVSPYSTSLHVSSSQSFKQAASFSQIQTFAVSYASQKLATAFVQKR